MNLRISQFGQTALAAIALAVTSSARAAAEKPVDLPPWISQAPVLRSGDAQSFRFRASVEMFGLHLIAYVSWAPPDHRSVILCDGADGLPLAISVDGHAWIYDLISGQILRSKDEPVFDISAKGERLDVKVGIHSSAGSGVIQVDLASIFGQGGGDLHTTEDSKGRVASMTSRNSQTKVRLRVTSANPPQPVALRIFVPNENPPVRVVLDAFRFGSPPPHWHHPLDTDTLAQDVPFCDLENMKDVPKDKQEEIEAFKQLLLAGGTFLIRPALHDPVARQRLEQLPIKINFYQVALHEKFLRNAWFRALERQDSDPARFALELLSTDESAKNAGGGTEMPKHAAGLNPAVVVVDLERLFAGHPDTEKAQRELTARATAEEEARRSEMETAHKLVSEAAVLDKKLAGQDLSEEERKELTNARAEKAAEVGRINERTSAYIAETDQWKAAVHDDIVKKIELSLHGLGNGNEAVVVLDKSASSANKIPAVIYSSEKMDLSDQALEAIRSGKPIAPEVIESVPRKVRMASVDLYKVFNSLRETKAVNDQLAEVTDSTNAEIKDRTESLKTLADEINRLIGEAQKAGPDDPQKEEKKSVLKEKTLLLQQGEKGLKEVEAARDRRFAEINKSGLIRIPHEMQQAVADLARAAGADLVLDSSGQNSTSTSMVFHVKGIPDWTESLIEKLNRVSPETKAHAAAASNRTVSSEYLRFGVLDFQKVLGGTPAGEAFQRKQTETDAKLKELAAKGENAGDAKDAILAEGRALLDSLVRAVNEAIATEEGELDYNIVFETGGKSDNGAPLTPAHEKVPDLTQKAIKALNESGQ